MRVAACCCLLAAVACAHQSRTDRPSRPSATMITAEDIERAPGVPLEQLLVARVPGVTLGRAPDGRLVLRIRGTTTITGNEEPLYVLDGIPLEPNPGGNLNAVDRHDVASIEVLKDAAGSAMYGVRGAGGIILIKTKRPPPPAPLPPDSH
jgi:TonB-dependent starch-binding outer membrane protein SusC